MDGESLAALRQHLSAYRTGTGLAHRVAAHLDLWRDRGGYGFGELGVIRALAEGLGVECACMAAEWRVLFATATLVEELGVALMAE